MAATRAAATAELERVLRDHSQQRRQLEQLRSEPMPKFELPQQSEQHRRFDELQRFEQRPRTILYIGLAVVAVLFVVSWVMLDHMRCDIFYSDVPFSSHRQSCR